jgi:hypothetical protein
MTATTATFSIQAAVRAVLDETDLTDPGDVADVVIKDMPDEAQRESFRFLLRDFVRVQFHRYPTENSVTPKARSAKQEAIRAYAQKWLRGRIFTGEDYKLRADCTQDDVQQIISARFRERDKLDQAGKRWETVLSEMIRHGAESIGDLPTSVIFSLEQDLPE